VLLWHTCLLYHITICRCYWCIPRGATKWRQIPVFGRIAAEIKQYL
jgi:hypothetical protein